MNKETILMMLENLAHYKKFNSPDGLPLIEGSDYGKNCLNLILTESYKKSPDWLNGFNTDVETGWSLLAISWTQGKYSYCLFGDDTETDTLDFDLEQISEYVGLSTSNIKSLFIEMIKDLHNEVISQFSELFNIELIEIQGFKLPKYLFKKGLTLDLNYSDALPKAGYKETWVSKSIKEILVMAQHEAVKAYLSINS